MADTKISAGANPTTLVATDKVPVARSASTTAYAATIAQVATYTNSTLPYSATTPVVDGTGTSGSAATVSRGDHVHPTDTSRLSTAGGTVGALTGTTATFSGRVTPDNIVIGNGGIQGFASVNGMSLDATNGAIFDHSVCAVSVNRLGANGTAMNFLQGATLCGSISVANGTSTAYNTSSDARLKEDSRSFDAGPIIDALNPCDFAWKANGLRAHGVIAQEAADIFPAAVTHDEEADTWGVDYSKFVPLLLAEVKALRARVAALESAAS